MAKIKSFFDKKRYPLLFTLSVIVSLLGLWLFIQNSYNLVKSANIGEPIDNASVEHPSNAITPNPADTHTPKKALTLDKSNQKSNDSSRLLYDFRPTDGEKFAKLSIPKLKLALPIYEGTTKETLRKGVGHYSGSVLPGENDNSILSGHRDTVFRNLYKLKKGDQLIVSTREHTFKYQIHKIRIVDKDDKTVIVPKPNATLTLSTCYPFQYIGHAPKRYIIEAFMVS